MKKILFLILIISTLAFTVVKTGNMSVLINPNSKLHILGKTNINTFKCEFNILKLKKPIDVSFNKTDNKIIFNNTMLVLDNNCFDCGGKTINKDFKELLKSDIYPKTNIKLKEIIKESNNHNSVYALLEISIAGITKAYKMPVDIKEEDNMLLIEGVLSLNICDFNLEPPKKALGLIVVKDVIEISFNLLVKEH